MTVRAKFRVNALKTILDYNGNKQEIVDLMAVSDDANKAWSMYTPQGTISLTITNPAAVEQLALGKFFYVDFTEAPAVDPKPAG